MRFIALLFALSWGQAWGAAYYAAPGGGAAASCVDATTNVCTLSRAVAVAANGDSINLAAGTYVGTELGAAGYVLMTSKLINLTCAGTRTCILRPSVSTAGIRLVTPPNGATATFTGLYIDGVNGTSPNYCIWASDAAAAIYNVNVVSSTCSDPVFYGFYSAATGINVTLTDFVMTASTAVHGRSFLYTERSATQWAAGTITVNGGSAQIDSHNVGGTGVINIEAFAAGLTASVNNWAGSVTLDPTLTSTGEHACVQMLNVASATIQNSSCTVNGNVGSRSTALFRINSCGNLAGQGCVGSETPRAITTAVIANNIGVVGTPGGYGAIIGQDATSSADNQISNALIKNNNITCTVPATTAHGQMLGYLAGGRVRGGFVTACGINYIAKKTSTTAPVFHGNISVNAVSQHFRAKGALATFTNNDAISTSGSANLYYFDVEPIAATNSTISLYNNIGYVVGGAPAYNVFMGSGDTLTAADRNDWYGLQNWSLAGSSYGSLGAWNGAASVGTDLNTDPAFADGSTPTTAAGACLDTDSALNNAGTWIGPYILDYNSHGFDNPPHVGAMTWCRDRAPAASRVPASRVAN